MDPGYPHDLSRWRGITSDIDAAMQWTDGIFKFLFFFLLKTHFFGLLKLVYLFVMFKGRTYFFKNKMFWRFDDTLVRTDMRYPQEAPPFWLGCPE